jgi:ribonuclease P protein component
MELMDLLSTKTSVIEVISLTSKPPLKILRKRSDFLRAARSKSFVTPGFILQIYSHKSDHLVRFGCTCSKKVGNAVARNRAKRRLREIARLVITESGEAGTDYVLIGRARETVKLPFDKMLKDLRAIVVKTL